MTILLRFRSQDLLQCRFAISPLNETNDALRFLTRRELNCHPGADGYHLPWQRQVRGLLPGLGIAPLLAIMSIRGYQPDFLNPAPDSPFTEIGAELDQVRATAPDRVAAEMAWTLGLPEVAGQGAAGHGAAGQAGHEAAGQGPNNRGTGDAGRVLRDHPELAGDPGQVRDMLAGMTHRAWTALVEPWWPRLRDVLDADITYRARRLADAGVAATLGELSKHISLSPSGVLRFAMPGQTQEIDVSGSEIVLVPSVFSWPGVGLSWDPPAAVYPARGIFGLWEPGTSSAGDLARLVGRTRAALLTALAEPASTTGLAARTRIPVSSVSEHLAVLRATGLVATTRTGRSLTHQRTALGTLLAQGEDPLEPPGRAPLGRNALPSPALPPSSVAPAQSRASRGALLQP